MEMVSRSILPASYRYLAEVAKAERLTEQCSCACASAKAAVEKLCVSIDVAAGAAEALRRTLEINEKDDLEIYVEGASIILRKYRPTCVFCNGAKNIITYKGKNICPRCLKGIKNLEIT